MKIVGLALAASLTVLCAETRARAQSSDTARGDDKAAMERARAAFAEGVDLYDKKQYEAALAKFREVYKDRPTPGIKRNIALCLRAMGRNAEAITTLEEMLAEGRDGRDAIKPDVRAAAEQAIAEMMPTVGNARLILDVLPAPSPVPRDQISITVDGEPRSAMNDVVRLAPGEHVITARAPGCYQASEKVTVRAGDRDVPVRLEIASTDAYGRVTVKASRPDAQIAVDGIVRGMQGSWAGFLPVGRHHLQVDAPGSPPHVGWLDMYQNRTEQIVVDVDPPRDRPPVYLATRPEIQAAPAPATPERDWQLFSSGGYQAQGVTVTQLLGEAAPTKRTYKGFVFSARADRRFAKGWSFDFLGEVGALSTTGLGASTTVTPESSFTIWTLAPGVRFRTAGSVRFTIAMNAGVLGQHLSGKYGAPGASLATVERSDAALSPVGIVELGTQIELGKGGVLLELTGFGDLHSVKALREVNSDGAFFQESAAARYGARASLGWEF